MFSLRTFQCHSCREFINTGMEKCRYCGVTIDPSIATAAVKTQEKVNRACNDASLIRNFAGVMWVGFFLRFIPFIGIGGLALMLMGLFLVPIRLIYWQARYGGIITADVDYKRAKRNWIMALVLWVLLLVIVVFGIMLLAGLSYVGSRR
jgi:hypothetical protein